MLRIGLVVLALTTAGCLQKEITHTLYLAPDGSLTWTASEAQVYSDEADPGKRAAEEQAYIGPALLGTHPVARGLQALGPDSLVRTAVLRDERPFHVVTDATFARADRALERLFVENGLPGRATLTYADDRASLRVRFDFSRQMVDRETPAAALLEGIEHFVFVLQEGSFVAGGGVDVPDRARARISKEWMSAVENAIDARTTIDLVLTWDTHDNRR